MIDLRSDTVTRPDAAMRKAMADAEVGDDVFGEDPTVNRLQDMVAERLGKEAALFVPSGTMSNQLAVRIHTEPGDEVVCEASCHIVNYESGATAALSGANLRTLPGRKGVLDGKDIRGAVRSHYYWEPRQRVLCLENTHNKAGGTIYPMDRLTDAVGAARDAGFTCHLDGARLWNAAVASGISESEWAAPFDTVSVCLSKGLGAPVGSLLVGHAEGIRRAHRYRKMFGGGMRQVGILAAAGIHALTHNRDRLAEDHAHARRLAEGLAGLPGVSVDLERVETNIVMFDVERDAVKLVEACKARGVALSPFGPHTIRATTHKDVSAREIETAITVLGQVLSSD
jgi:threonine aldolase